MMRRANVADCGVCDGSGLVWSERESAVRGWRPILSYCSARVENQNSSLSVNTNPWTAVLIVAPFEE